MKKNILITSVALFLVLTASADPVFARDLVEAAQSAQSMFNRIGIAAISIGITLGGVLYAIGMAMVGRMLLMSGLVGAACILGAPAIVNMLGKVFGASV